MKPSIESHGDHHDAHVGIHPPRDGSAQGLVPPDGTGARREVLQEIWTVLSSVSDLHLSQATALFAEPARRWFVSGQGRSGLVAQMAAMRLMHLGFDAHAIGEATAPSIGRGDGLVMFSGSGETPVTLHLAGLAREFGADILAFTTRTDSTLAGLAEVVIEVPVAETVQFGGSLFEQSALLLFDVVVLELTQRDPAAYELMQRRHTNLQ